MRSQKIRGHNRRRKQFDNWITADSNIDIVELVSMYKSWKSQHFVRPWRGISFVNSIIPEPKNRTRRQILNGLEKIYDSWKIQLDEFEKPYYLKIWAYEPRVSRSQVVCAIDDHIDRYEKLFRASSDSHKYASVKKEFSSEFKWLEFVDDDVYFENDLSTPPEYYDNIDSYNYSIKLLNNLKKRNLSTRIIETPSGENDKLYFVPQGKIYVGDKS